MSWTATRQIASSQRSLVVLEKLVLERRRAQKLGALDSIAGFAGSGRCFPGAFGDGAAAGTRSIISAVPERIHLNAEYRARGERGRRNALLGHRRGARHLDAPVGVLPFFVLDEFAVEPD